MLLYAKSARSKGMHLKILSLSMSRTGFVNETKAVASEAWPTYAKTLIAQKYRNTSRTHNDMTEPNQVGRLHPKPHLLLRAVHPATVLLRVTGQQPRN